MWVYGRVGGLIGAVVCGSSSAGPALQAGGLAGRFKMLRGGVHPPLIEWRTVNPFATDAISGGCPLS